MDHDEWCDDQETVRISTEYHDFDIAYRETGSGEPATLFLHGVSGWGWVFRSVCDAVGHAILPDLPGRGYSRHIGPGGYDRSVRAYEEYVIELLDELEHTSVQVIGHDIGGTIALRLAIHTDRIDRMVLSNAPIYDSWPSARVHELGTPERARNMTYREVDELWRSKFETATYNPDRATDKFVEGMVAPYLDPDMPPETLALNAVSLNTNHTLELVPHYEDITVPTLLLWGIPGGGQHVAYAKRLAADLPTAETRFLDRSSHWPMQDRPDAYYEGINEFLD